jgi:DNA-directed RNA polymerase specialized sigma24 family protein
MAKELSIPDIADKASSRHITPEAFAMLLKALGDSSSRGNQYEKLRSKLIFFFSRRLLRFPEDLADEVLDRLAFRLSQGTEIASIEAFALGIARHVAQEQSARKDLHQGVDNTFFDNIPSNSATQSSEEEIVRMERCLKKLPSSEARLLKSYYLSTTNELIRARRSLAEKLGISQLALRQRVFLARQKMRDCMIEADRKKEK